MYAGRYDEALESFRRQKEIVSVGITRYNTQAWGNMAEAYSRKGDLRNALRCLDVPEKVALENNVKDVLMGIYKSKENYHRQLGETAKADDYARKRMHIMDELVAYRRYRA